jgi:hypothetical protein
MVRVAFDMRLAASARSQRLSWKQYIQAHLEVGAARFNLVSGITVLCPSISEKAAPSNTVRTLKIAGTRCHCSLAIEHAGQHGNTLFREGIRKRAAPPTVPRT